MKCFFYLFICFIFVLYPQFCLLLVFFLIFYRNTERYAFAARVSVENDELCRNAFSATASIFLQTQTKFYLLLWFHLSSSLPFCCPLSISMKYSLYGFRLLVFLLGYAFSKHVFPVKTFDCLCYVQLYFVNSIYLLLWLWQEVCSFMAMFITLYTFVFVVSFTFCALHKLFLVVSDYVINICVE